MANTSATKGGRYQYRTLAQNLARSIYYWLCYVKNSTDSNVLLESSVRFPLVEYLERREGITSVCLEKKIKGYSHRAFDFYFEKRDKTTDKVTGKTKEITRARFYVEIKFVSIDTGDATIRQRVFDDLSRLRYYAKKDTFCYFIMCGPTVMFRTSFQSVAPKVERGEFPQYKIGEEPTLYTSVYNDWFSFSISEPEKSIDITDIKHRKYSKHFDKDYKKGKLKSLSFISRLIQIFPNGNDVESPQSVGIWQISEP